MSNLVSEQVIKEDLSQSLSMWTVDQAGEVWLAVGWAGVGGCLYQSCIGRVGRMRRLAAAGHNKQARQQE